jgi:nicotinate-nucleotide adenylyltransferase
MSETRRIGLFGGTFDPVHLGHLHLARAARESLALDEVRFIPCRISPHKLGSAPTPAAERLAMLRLATRDEPWAVVDESETRRDGPSYSWRTAWEMRDRFPEARLFWIMGTDQWEALPDWAHPERLAECVEFIVFSRGAPAAPRDGHHLHAIHADHPASATAVREALARGDIGIPWLDPQVEAHIRRLGIYPGKDNRTADGRG